MEDWMIETCMLRGQSEKHKKLVKDSNEIIKAILKQVQRPYVAFSCGKDSTVLAHMVLQHDKSIPLRFLSSGETRLVHDVDRIINYFMGLGATVDEINIDRVFSDEWKEASWDDQRKAGRGDLEKLNQGDWDCIFMGLRVGESKQRKMSLMCHQTEDLPPFCHRYTSKARANIIRCCPLALWKTEDVGAYLIEHELPWLDWYDYQGFEGRTTARLTGDSVRQNALTWLKLYKPQNFNVLAARFPEFRLYI